MYYINILCYNLYTLMVFSRHKNLHALRENPEQYQLEINIGQILWR
jgi:hypothetical protein